MSNPLTHIHRFITAHYDLEELRTLSHDLGVEYDDLPGEGRSARARELVRRLAREQGLDHLLDELRHTRTVPFEEAGLSADPAALEALYKALPALQAGSAPGSGDRIVVGDARSATVAVGRRSAAAARGGVAISGDVGGDVVISFGPRQLAISRMAQILIGLIALGVAFLVVAQAFGLRTSTAPPVMEGDFNVAVAQFQVVGQGEGLEEAHDLAQSFANAIDRELRTLAAEIDQHIEVRTPQATGPVEGGTEAARAENAHALAERIGADVVIYGLIEVDGLAATIKPEFTVRSQEFTAVAEMTGQYRMGSPLSVDKVDNVARKRQASELMADRFRALTLVTYGLADYVIGNYPEAETSFDAALNTQAWDNPDVIYCMLCNAAFKQGHWTDAEGYCRQALEINPAYSRAYVGLGSTFYLQALGDSAGETYAAVDLDLLQRSIENYRLALDPGLDHPPLADVSTKASFSLGQAYWVAALFEAEVGDAGASEQARSLAIRAFQAVIQDHGDGANPRVRELAAYAHARLGLIYRQTAQLEAAIPEYERALDLLPPLDRTRDQRAAYEAALGEIHVALDRPAEAIVWYRRAVEHAPAGSEWQTRYQERLDALR